MATAQITSPTGIGRGFLLNFLQSILNSFRHDANAGLNVCLINVIQLHPTRMHGNQLLFVLKINEVMLNLILHHLEQDLRLIILGLPHDQKTHPFGAAQDAQRKAFMGIDLINFRLW